MTTSAVGCITYQPTQTSPVKLKARGHVNKLKTAEEAIAYFEGKLAKWTQRVAEQGGKVDTLIPNMAFRAYMPNGFSIYYELIVTAEAK